MPEDLLKHHKLFRALPPESFNLLTENLRRETLEAKTVIFREGAYPAGVYVLARGHVKLYKTGNLGKQQIFRICGPGEIFGFHPIFTNDFYPDTAETISAADIGFIPRADFEKVIQISHPVCLRLLELLCQEFRDFIEQETYLVQKPLRERVAKCMLTLQEVYADPIAGHPILTLPRSDFADYVGTTVESLARTLHDYKEANLIEVQGRKIHLLDLDGLATTSGE